MSRVFPETGQPIFDLTTDEIVGTVTEVDDVCFGMKPMPGKTITDAYLVLANGQHLNILSDPSFRSEPEEGEIDGH